MQRQHDDRRHDADLFGQRRDLDGQLQRRRVHEAVDEMMLGQAHGIEAQCVSKHGLVDHVAIDPIASVGLVRIVRGQLNAELHRATMARPSQRGNHRRAAAPASSSDG